jgi:large subunit ribosomal protein L21
MYAVVSTGGKQYKVAKGDVIDVEKLDAKPGDTVSLPVLLLSDGKKVKVNGLSNKEVKCKVVEQFRGEKQVVFKLKKRKRYHRTQGHRQDLTKLEVVTVPPLTTPRKKKAETEAAPAAEEAEKAAE